jgi:hypothetical protein
MTINRLEPAQRYLGVGEVKPGPRERGGCSVLAAGTLFHSA